MVNLKAKTRKEIGRKTYKLRKEGKIPAVLYGPKLENITIEVDLKDFGKVYQEAGENSLIELVLGDKKFMVLIHAVEMEAVSQKPIHVDFYQPDLTKEIVTDIPLVFEGEAPAVKSLGGTLVKNIHEVEVKALPQNLPHEIRVDITKLSNFGDSIVIGDLVLPSEVKIQKESDEIIALVAEPQKVEEELAKPLEENVEEVGKAEEKKETEEVEESKGETSEK